MLTKCMYRSSGRYNYFVDRATENAESFIMCKQYCHLTEVPVDSSIQPHRSDHHIHRDWEASLLQTSRRLFIRYYPSCALVANCEKTVFGYKGIKTQQIMQRADQTQQTTTTVMQKRVYHADQTNCGYFKEIRFVSRQQSIRSIKQSK
jgi:hypothetical protein